MSDRLSVSKKPQLPVCSQVCSQAPVYLTVRKTGEDSVHNTLHTMYRRGQCTQYTPYNVQSQDFTQTCPNRTLVYQHVIYQIYKTI